MSIAFNKLWCNLHIRERDWFNFFNYWLYVFFKYYKRIISTNILFQEISYSQRCYQTDSIVSQVTRYSYILDWILSTLHYRLKNFVAMYFINTFFSAANEFFGMLDLVVILRLKSLLRPLTFIAQKSLFNEEEQWILFFFKGRKFAC